MPKITLPDGSKRDFDSAVSVLSVARDIGEGLAKATIAGKVNGIQVDSSYLIEKDAVLEILTDTSEEGLSIIRHSTAHLMAMAIKELFPEAQITIGPVIENGFFYDIAYQRAFTPDDLKIIEERMKELSEKNFEISREEVSRDEALNLFDKLGEHYKSEIIKDIPDSEVLSLYRQGSFVDLCRGPHVASTGKLSVFKLTKVAGAYWRGDSKNETLQRIYGTAWARKKDMKVYLNRLEEAEKRDHRKLNKKLGLFHFSDEAPGSVFWHPKGWKLFMQLLNYMRKRQDDAGYIEVNTPDVMDRSLWETSGHWFNYRENMFITQTEDERIFALKPMNCPGSVSIYSQGLKSYRDLPIRMAELGKVHRYEPSGSLHGLMRVRHFTQDDAHIYCTEDQMESECVEVVSLVLDIYKDFGFDDVVIKLSTRPEKRIGNDEVWDKLEGALISSLKVMGLDYILYPGEGAFYGPKLEFVLRDAIGRDWQCGTLQVDMNLPERFDITYVDETGSRDKRPVLLHRALFGSLERFIGILIENYEGAFPFWLAPEQVIIVNITDSNAEYAKKVTKILTNEGFRANCDLRNEKIGFKIRDHSMQRVPFIAVVGDKEKESSTISVRNREGKDLGSMTIDESIAFFSKENTYIKQ